MNIPTVLKHIIDSSLFKIKILMKIIYIPKIGVNLENEKI